MADSRVEPHKLVPLLKNEELQEMIPFFVKRKDGSDDHKCGSCSMRVVKKDGTSECTVMKRSGGISLTKGTCNYYASGDAAKEGDIRPARMSPDTAGYVETDKKVQCGTCALATSPFYCGLWNGRFSDPGDCCAAWQEKKA